MAARIGAEIAGTGDPDLELTDVGPLHEAGKGVISFLDNRKYLDAFETSKASACIIDSRFADKAPEGMVLLLSHEPYKAFALAAAAFYPPEKVEAGRSESAVIDPSAVIGEGCSIEAGAVIKPGVQLGKRCRIGANAVIGVAVTIGEDSDIGENGALSHCDVGARALIQPGVRIGQRGIGFAIAAKGLVRVPQLGRVNNGNEVGMGAYYLCERGATPYTATRYW